MCIRDSNGRLLSNRFQLSPYNMHVSVTLYGMVSLSASNIVFCLTTSPCTATVGSKVHTKKVRLPCMEWIRSMSTSKRGEKRQKTVGEATSSEKNWPAVLVPLSLWSVKNKEVSC